MKNEVYRYLEMVPGSDLEIDALIDKYLVEVNKYTGKYNYQVYDLQHSPLRIKDFHAFDSKSLEKVMGHSEQVLLFVATLGATFEQALNKLSYSNPTEMMIFNACGSARVEAILDEMEIKIARTHDLYHTPRYSPGYGDFSLEFQKYIVQVLKASSIGIDVNAYGLLMPSKSVAGVIGISKIKSSTSYDICDGCLKRMTCNQKICRRES